MTSHPRAWRSPGSSRWLWTDGRERARATRQTARTGPDQRSRSWRISYLGGNGLGLLCAGATRAAVNRDWPEHPGASPRVRLVATRPARPAQSPDPRALHRPRCAKMNVDPFRNRCNLRTGPVRGHSRNVFAEDAMWWVERSASESDWAVGSGGMTPARCGCRCQQPKLVMDQRHEWSTRIRLPHGRACGVPGRAHCRAPQQPGCVGRHLRVSAGLDGRELSWSS